MAKTDKKINLKKVGKNVLDNLVETHKDKEPSESWWSFQILAKLGIVPDPNASGEAAENQAKVANMTPQEREAKMKEIGIMLPKRKMIEFQKSMKAMAKQNHKKLMEAAEAKFGASDVNLLRKMGMSPEDIANADP